MTNPAEKMKKIYLKDYEAPHFTISRIDLAFDIMEDLCRVSSKMQVRILDSNRTLFLNGEELELEDLQINGKPGTYESNSDGLVLRDLPESFELAITNRIKPQLNTSLEGLYKSGATFITQCEAQGFRRITYFPDRPDVMTQFTATITADAKKYPILLSNGDCTHSSMDAQGRKTVTWVDPHKKPCYLFALVAGDFGVIKDIFTTRSGKKVQLEIYSPHGTQKRCEHAMESLKKSMKWDEERFGREYDLSTYMIVATDDFNAGAMENKGLNIFNSRLILADEKTATDFDYFNIESVVAHEYFHNWTGNRVTLRDWFHLSLKEGLTVFRDQEFSMDMASKALVRIDTVDTLRVSQFAEDAGPNAHPIRPASCYAVDNFFTSTIYEKGAEVIRMMQTMVGRPGFRKGMDLYFERHDGQAVIIEDFAKAISDANQQDWSQFKLWYSQAGTPTVSVKESYDQKAQVYSLELSQSSALTAQEKAEGLQKQPFHIPMIIGLLDSSGKNLELRCDKAIINSEGQTLLHLKNTKEVYAFEQIPSRPVLSLNREFSAPIKLQWEAQFSDLLHLLKFDSDEFNRWEASQKIYRTSLQKMIKEFQSTGRSTTPKELIEAFIFVVSDKNIDTELKAKLMTLPAIEVITQDSSELDAETFQRALDQMKVDFARACKSELLAIYQTHHGKNVFSKDPKDFGKRRLKNLCLDYLATSEENWPIVRNQFENAQIMTDEIAALSILLNTNDSYKAEASEKFYQKWKSEFLVILKWFQVQATIPHRSTFDLVKKLSAHPDFVKTNPNKVYALIRSFGRNITAFYGGDGSSFEFMSDMIIELDKLNPQVATRVASCFDLWTKLPAGKKEKARLSLQKMEKSGLSKNTYEIVKKNLEAE